MQNAKMQKKKKTKLPRINGKISFNKKRSFRPIFVLLYSFERFVRVIFVCSDYNHCNYYQSNNCGWKDIYIYIEGERVKSISNNFKRNELKNFSCYDSFWIVNCNDII